MQNKKLLAAALVAMMPFAASAGVYTAQVSGAPGATVTLNVSFTGDGATAETQTDLTFSNANITISNPQILNGATNCLVINPTTLRIIPPSGGSNPLPAGPTNYCSFSVAIAPAAPEALIPFTAVGIECTNAMAGSEPCTLAAGSGVNVVNTPVPRTLSYNPTAGSNIAFAAGATPGTPAPAQQIAVTAAGTTGTATLSGCAISGAGASSFSVTPSSLSFPSSNTQNLNLGCTYPTSNATATLTCTETNAGGSPTARAWNLSCPAPSVNPTITSVPASGTPLTVSGGIAGTQGLALIDLSATGGSGAGSTAISCTSTGTVQVANAPGTPSGPGPAAQTVTGTNQPLDIRVGVQLGATAQSPAGTVTCTVAGQANLVFDVNAPAGTTVVPPQFIPSSSTWSTIALLSLLGVFGLLAVGFRRQ